MEITRKTIANDEEYLRQVSKPVDFNNNDWQDAVKKLDEFCKNYDNCLAMASVQLGIPLCLIYIKKTDLNRLEENYNEERVMINPKILKSEGLTTYWEACASCLDNMGLVERPYKITVEYYDIEGKRYEEIYEGFPCTVLSHEIDHLDGILHIDFAKEILQMKKDDRKNWRKTHPYEVIRKEGKYIHPLKKDKN